MSISDKDKEIIESAELQRQFGLSQFDIVVNQLLNSLAIHSSICLETLYCQIKVKNGKVVGKDILRLINLFKQQSELQKQINDEIKFYKDKIAEIADTGKINLTSAEFFQHFTLNNPYKSIVTQQIQDQISEYKSVSVTNLSNLIQKVQQSQSLNCINRKSTKKHEIHQHETQHTELSQVFNNQLIQTAKLSAILQDTITNPQVLVKLQGMIQSLNEKLREKCQLIEDHQEHIRKMQRREKKAHQQIYRLQYQIQEKDNLICKLNEQNELYEQEIQIFERKCQEDFIETISKLNQENIRLLKEKQQALALCQKLAKELEWVNINYNGIAKEYQNFVITTQSEKKEEKLESEGEHLMPDILKQELKQAYEKINKLRKLNMQLQTRVMDLQTELDCKAIASNPLTDRTFNNLALDEKVPNYMMEDPKETFLQLLRKNSCNQQFQESLSNGLKQQRCNSIRLIKSLTKQFFLSQKKPLANNYSTNETNKTNFHQLPPPKPINLKHSLRQYDFAGLLDSEILKPVTNIIESFNTLSPIQPIFSSQAWMMQPHGPQQKFILLLTSARLVLCRASYSSIAESFQTATILEFCFCQNMRTWLVVKFKDGVVNSKGKIIKQFVIQIKNRSELIKYLFKNGFLCAENQINLTFKSEQQIIVVRKQRVISLSSFVGTANFIDRSINDGENVFEVTINENSSFFFRNITVVIVINSIGILIFDKNKNKIATTFQQKLKLKKLLPFCESQQIIDLSQNKRIKLVYPSINTSYTLQFCSYAQAKLAESKIKIQKQHRVGERAKQDAKSVSIFLALKKMRSIQGSGDLCVSL